MNWCRTNSMTSRCKCAREVVPKNINVLLQWQGGMGTSKSLSGVLYRRAGRPTKCWPAFKACPIPLPFVPPSID